jgi:hypothetical protein
VIKDGHESLLRSQLCSAGFEADEDFVILENPSTVPMAATHVTSSLTCFRFALAPRTCRSASMNWRAQALERRVDIGAPGLDGLERLLDVAFSGFLISKSASSTAINSTSALGLRG